MLELVAGILLAAGAVVFVLRPIFGAWGSEPGDTGAVTAGEDPDDDLSARAVAVRALREIEFDRATGKLSDADYEALKQKYTAAALAALRTEAAGGGMRDAESEASGALAHTASRIAHPVCPTHGPRSEADALFCSECGRRLGAAPGYCTRCGTALEQEARYCHTCGARVAA